MIAKAERIETVVTIHNVESDRFDQNSFSIEALVPDFTTPDRSIPTKFIKWAKVQGNAPKKGAEGLALLAPTVIQKRHVTSGKYPSTEVTGEEMSYEVNWEMLEFTPTEARKPTEQGGNTLQSNNRILKASETPPVNGTLRHKVDAMMVNDREAIRMVLTHGQEENGNTYALIEDVLREAELVADWLNSRFLVRLAGDSPLVNTAIEEGAEIVDVTTLDDAEQLSMDEAESKSMLPEIRNETDLRYWISTQNYEAKDIREVLASLHVQKVTDYLAKAGNTAQGLASILHKKLGDDVQF